MQDVRASWFNAYSSSPASSVTLERMFDTCSYNKLLWKPQNNIVTQVAMPCTGVRPDDKQPALQVSFNFSLCRNPNEFDTWRYYAAKHIRETVSSFVKHSNIQSSTG